MPVVVCSHVQICATVVRVNTRMRRRYELFMPCMQSQAWSPPYKPSTCKPNDDADIAAYGFDFMAQFGPLMAAPGSRNGAFVDACIIHGSTTSAIDGRTNGQAFEAWCARAVPPTCIPRAARQFT